MISERDQQARTHRESVQVSRCHEGAAILARRGARGGMAEPRSDQARLPANRSRGRLGGVRYQRQPLSFDRASRVPAPAPVHQGIPDPRRIQQRSMEEMATLTETVYGALLSQTRPRV